MLVSIRILTEILNEQEVGNYYLLITILALFNFAFLNPLGQYYGRHIILWKHNKNLLNATNVLLFLRFTAIIFSLFIAFATYQIFEYEKYYSTGQFLLFVFISLVAGTHSVLLSIINTLGDRIRFVKYFVFTLTLGFIFSLLIVYFIDKSGMGWLYGIALSQLIFSIGIYRYTAKGDEVSIDKIKAAFHNNKYIKKIALFIIPVTITLFLQWGQSTSYRFIIEAKYSIETLAYIGVGLAVSAAIFGSIESLATQFYAPIYLKRITHANKEDRANAWNELASYMVPIYILLALFVMSLAPYLTNLLVAEKFYQSYIYTMFGVIIEFVRVITNMVFMVSQSEVKTNNTIFPYGVGFILTISIMYLFDMSEKLWMIPVSLGFSHGIIFIILFINMRKLLDIKINIVNIFKSLGLALPFLLILLVQHHQSTFQSITLLMISGIYLVVIIYLITQKQILRIGRRE